MAETRSQSRANERSNELLDPIEDGEVPDSPPPTHTQSLQGIAIDQFNSSASILGFSPQDIEDFLQRRLPAVETPPINPSIIVQDTPVPLRVRDPSLPKPLENSSFDLKTLAKDKFHVSSNNNKERFETLDNVLIHNGLYTMVMKTRRVPTVTALNPYGQSADIISVVDNVVTIIKADNVHLWCDDMNRLMQILLAAFDRTLHHHSKGFLAKDGILAYNDLRDFYYKQNNQGAKETRHALEAFKIKPASNSIRQDIVLFEELRVACEYSVKTTFNDLTNNSYLDEKFETDTRPGVVASLTASSQAKWTYIQRLDALHQLQNCDTKASSKDVPIKSMTP
jgi:hypothetical protein